MSDDLQRAHRGVAERLICLHDEIKAEGSLAALNRIAVALYDAKTDLLKTFIHSTDGDSPLVNHTSRLADLPSLQVLARTGARRIINDLSLAAENGQEHARRLIAAGYHSSYTMPIAHRGVLYGFLFFNSFRPGFFDGAVIQRLRPYGELIGMAIMRELDTFRMMRAAVKVIRSVSSARDEETGAHLSRMARYARLIGQDMAAAHDLSDEFLEYLFQFCPLHDVGKIAVPDAILLKPERLNEDEFALMKTHVAKGVEIVEGMINDFQLSTVPHFKVLRNIVAYHHESLDGCGYPYGLSAEAIPLEARIAAVADVFDALTSKRPYKEPWGIGAALGLLRDQSGVKFDPDCVAALCRHETEIVEIQAKFRETVFD